MHIIEQGIPIPFIPAHLKPPRSTNRHITALDNLKINETYTVSHEKMRSIQAVCSRFKRLHPGWHYKTRSIMVNNQMFIKVTRCE